MTLPLDKCQSTEDMLQKFLCYNALGLRQEAKRAVSALVNSFPNLESKKVWTLDNLDRIPKNYESCIRHEIYENIIFPVLKDGFERGDPKASYLLGEYSQNLYKNRSLFEQMDERTEIDFFRIAFISEPKSVQYQRAYLGSLVSNLRYIFHEWPSGILIDQTNWREELSDLRAQVLLALSLDRESQYSDLLAEWTNIIDQYKVRLEKWEVGL